MPVEAPTESIVPVRIRPAVFDNVPVRVLTLVLLFTTAAAYETYELRSLLNRDIWWHLRTGLWIVQNHAVPTHGLFSQHSAAPWIASSWGYDLLTAVAHRLLGLRAIPTVLMGLKVALAVVTFRLAGGWSGRFWGAVLLSSSAQYVLIDVQPLPEVCSIVFFGIELALLLHTRRSGDLRPLFWLPLLFVLWANVHVQFVVGLLLLAFFMLVTAVERVLHSSGVSGMATRRLPLREVAVVLGGVTLATLLTPYSFHLLPDAIASLYNKVLFENFAEMTAMGFRRPQEFALLLLLMLAFLALGRQRSRDLFKIGLMVLLTLLAFRIQRDAWGVLLVAVAVVADWKPELGESVSGENARKGKRGKALCALLVLVVFVAAVVRIPDDQELMNRAARVFPKKACDFIRANQLAGPLFNAYVWGGFLTWYLPEYPVAIDGRLNLYGSEINERYFQITAGTQPLESDPVFSGAQTLVLEPHSGVAKALIDLPRFRAKYRVAYEDDVAVVLIRQ